MAVLNGRQVLLVGLKGDPGTEVVANPSEEATGGNLEKVKIDGVVYNASGGGGGGEGTLKVGATVTIDW